VQNLSGRNSNGTHLSEPKYLLKHHAYAVKQPDKAPMAANTGRMTSILLSQNVTNALFEEDKEILSVCKLMNMSLDLSNFFAAFISLQHRHKHQTLHILHELTTVGRGTYGDIVKELKIVK
jgi:hypothetical protein